MSKNKINIATVRKEYTKHQLRRKDLTAEPMDLFKIWLDQAYKAHIPEANAMNLATIDDNGQPYQRLVLLKDFDKSGMIFYTNLNSRKAHHIDNHPYISLHFFWHELERQVMILGEAKHLSSRQVIKYFYSRPKNSQISSYISHQSKIISSRKELETNFLEKKKLFLSNKVPVPKFWGGFKVYINVIEFWQGREHRLHDRFIYSKNKKKWSINRLAP